MIPFAPQFGVPYELVGPAGDRAVFNDPNDPDYVGPLTEVSGFDSPEVRESADDLVGFDGGIHGPFYYSRRPVVLSGSVINQSSSTSRNHALDRLMRATNAMRGDAILRWTPDGGSPVQTLLRRQQPVRITGAWAKTFQAPMVAADPRIYSQEVKTQSVSASGIANPSGRGYPETFDVDYGGGSVQGQMFVTNEGSADTYPILTVTGPGTNPAILNYTTGQYVSLFYTLGVGDQMVIDTLNRTIFVNGQSRYSALDFGRTNWWALQAGENELRLLWTNFAEPASLYVQWRDAWI